jgi:hypothetical protein
MQGDDSGGRALYRLTTRRVAVDAHEYELAHGLAKYLPGVADGLLKPTWPEFVHVAAVVHRPREREYSPGLHRYLEEKKQSRS